MGMENLLNYYFIMKKRFVTVLLACSLAGGLFAQQPWFKDKDLTLTGAYYYPEHWDESQWERDFKQMHDLGFEFTHFAEFAWAQLEPEEGKYDFAWLDKAVALAAKYDLKVIMCTSTATPPVWLSRKYPEILIKNENGTVLDHGARQHASFASPVYRELAYKMIEKLAQHYGNDSRIIGWQLDNEPAVQFDYNPKAELAFRDFLREKYGLNRSDITHEAFSDNFAALCDRNKRGRLGIMNKPLKIDGLLDIHNRENDCPLLVGVSADGVVKGCAVIEILCDEIADRLRIVGDNRKKFIQLHPLNRFVNQQCFRYQTENRTKSG